MPQQYAASKAVTAPHVRSSIEKSIEDLKKQRQSLKAASLALNNQEFRDSLRMRYNLPLED